MATQFLLSLFFLSSIVTEATDWNGIVAGGMYDMKLTDDRQPSLVQEFVFTKGDYYKPVRLDQETNSIIDLEKPFTLKFINGRYWEVSSGYIAVGDSGSASFFKLKQASGIYYLHHSIEPSDPIVKIDERGYLCTNCTGIDAEIKSLAKKSPRPSEDWNKIVTGGTYAMELSDSHQPCLMEEEEEERFVCATKEKNNFKSVRFIQSGDGNAIIKLEKSFKIVFDYIYYWKVSSKWIQVGDESAGSSFKFKKASDSDIYFLCYDNGASDPVVKIHARGKLCTNCNGTDAEITLKRKN